MRRLSARERVLSLAVGGVFFTLLTFGLISYLLRQHTTLQATLASKEGEWRTMQLLVAERGLWEQRDAWISEKQPKLANEGSAGVQLLDQIKGAARVHAVTVENPAIGAPETAEFYRTTPVNFETKSPWPALVKFLHALQQPEKFLVLDSANIQIDPTDPAMIRGKFRAAIWYAPKN